MDSFDLCISRESILSEFPTNSTLLVPTKRNSKVGILGTVDLLVVRKPPTIAEAGDSPKPYPIEWPKRFYGCG